MIQIIQSFKSEMTTKTDSNKKFALHRICLVVDAREL